MLSKFRLYGRKRYEVRLSALKHPKMRLKVRSVLPFTALRLIFNWTKLRRNCSLFQGYTGRLYLSTAHSPVLFDSLQEAPRSGEGFS